MAQAFKKVAVTKDIIGCRLAREIYAKDTTYVFVRKDVVITTFVYGRLVDEDIEEVVVYEETEESRSASAEANRRLDLAQQEHVARAVKLSDLFSDVINTHQLNIDETSKICTDIIKSNNNKYNVFLLLDSLRLFDDYLYAHSANVATLAGLFGRWLKFPEKDIECLTMCGLLHDIGKTMVDANILQKAGKLTEAEFSEIKNHTTNGYKILKDQDVPEVVKEVAFMHHEKIDGSGYPMGLKQAQISEYARIIAITDIFDAMTHARVYREKAHSPFTILKEFQEGVYGKLDLKYLSVFLQNVAYMYTGVKCSLTDGREGKIVFINPLNLYAPIVEVDGAMIDLQFEKSLGIDHIIMI